MRCITNTLENPWQTAGDLVVFKVLKKSALRLSTSCTLCTCVETVGDSPASVKYLGALEEFYKVSLEGVVWWFYRRFYSASLGLCKGPYRVVQ